MAPLNLVEKVIALEGVDLLGGLNPEQLSRIAAVATEVSYAPEKVVFDPKQASDALFVVLDGSVALSQGSEVLHVAHQNEVLGAWALFDRDPMPVTAKALEDTRLLRISRDDFYDLLSDNAEITASIFATLVRRFRALLEQVKA